MATKGRPRQFSNAADKQKAYRERKKQARIEAEALRKAEWDKSLDGLKAKRDAAAHASAEQLRAWHAAAGSIGEDGVNAWIKERLRLSDEWWEAQQRWYTAWKAAGFPPVSDRTGFEETP